METLKIKGLKELEKKAELEAKKEKAEEEEEEEERDKQKTYNVLYNCEGGGTSKYFNDFNFREYNPEAGNIISYILINREVNNYKLSHFKKSKEKIKFRIISKLEYQIEGTIKSIENNFVHIETKDKKEIIINLDEIDCRTIFPLSYDPVKYPSRYVPNHIREFVFKRDDYKCQLKLEGCTGIAEEIDHIIPVSKGGESIVENLQGSCFSCNRKKGKK